MSNMVVRTNIYALNSHRNMKNVGMQQKSASNRLSSGYRINSAADDAAGLAISETMRAQIRGLDQASRNAQDGQAMLLTTEGGLEEIGNMLQRTRELLVQASNDTNTQSQRSMIDQEINQLGEEILSMQTRVEFNTNQVLNIGYHASIRTAVATAASEFAAASSEVAEASELFAETVGEAKVEYAETIEEAEEEYAEAMEEAGEELTENMAELGEVPDSARNDQKVAYLAMFDAAAAAAKSTLSEATAEADETLAEAMQEATEELSESRDEFSVATSTYTATLGAQFFTVSEDLNKTGVAWYQVGANANQGINFDFATVSQAVLASGSLVKGIGEALVMSGSIRESGVGFGDEITPLINTVDDALNAVNNVRANLGAVQNRMDYTMRSLDISSENLSDSESRVRNADIAKEMMRFTMSNVLQQAAVSMLSQANQMPNNLLQLLR